MLLRFLLLAATLMAAVTTCDAQVDATLVSGTQGSDVVEAVVSVIKAACIFSDDRQFLRRLAYVESSDGTAFNAYRAGYDGGIWQVNQNMFDATRPCLGVLRVPCNNIQQRFGIAWTQVTWSDLRKPLYSGLAAALYMLQRAGTNSSFIPPSIEGQGQVWSQYYHFGNPPVTNFTTQAGRATEYSCNDDMDLLFVLDGSGSIDPADFILSLNFVINVVNALNVTQVVKVAAINFDTFPQVEFYFNNYTNKDGVLSAIRRIRQVGGGTGTNLALDLARTKVFTSLHGARSQTTTKRVAILITDGQSGEPFATALAAKRLRDESGVTIFSIGVGGFDLAELQNVATDPACSHVYTLPDFSLIQNIIQEIQRSVCKAQRTINTDIGIISTQTGSITSILTAPDNRNTTTVVSVSCGIVDVYISYTNPNPNPALYAEKYTATEGHPAYLTTSDTYNGQHVYMTVVGSRLPPTAAGLNNCTDFGYQVSVVPKITQIMCCNGADCHVCSDTELRQDHRIRQVVCSSPEEFHNPCSMEAMDSGHYIFVYPYDTSKFIRCDYRGNAYVTLCPLRETFNPATMTCGYETPGSSRVRPLPAGYPNPCTPAHIQAQYLFFDYTPDRTVYIHCDLWGHAFLEQCSEQSVWSQADQTCVDDRPNVVTSAPSTPAPLINPCTPEAMSAGRMYFPYPCDHTRFIHCDISGNYWVQFCPGGMFFDPAIYTCVVNDPQQGSQHGCD